MLILILLLLVLVARQARVRGPRGALDAIRDPAAEIRELARGLGLLARLVLLLPFGLEALEAQSAAHELLAAADGLVPRALRAVGVVLGDGARGRGAEGAELGGRVGSVMLGLGLVLVGVGLGL